MKKIIKEDERELVVEVSSGFLKGIGVAALFFLGFPLIRFFLRNPLDQEHLVGYIGAAVTCGLSYLVAFEEARFSFDSGTRLLTWRRRRSLSKKEGSIPFSQIEQVVLESAIGNNKYYPKHRVILRTGEGALPISLSYEHDDLNQAIAERIRSRLGLSPNALVADSIQSLVERGLDLDAIRLLREKEGLSLADAKKRIAEIKNQAERKTAAQTDSSL
ncbi:MAG: hypothetical protein EPO39_19940 [Candidatus Manganitrophaceae bacterium]|nr:MAG: hypothetical protein EPO39_19940 [Candidatus Manganitrophaceae bacterium]